MLIRSALGVADKRRIQAMLFANNGGDLRQQLLDSAPIYLPLTHTAVPARGSIVPSFTRATTATGQKWDEAGYLDFTALAGEIVWKGARRERNLLSNTGWLGGTSGTLGSGGVAPTGWTALGGTGSLTFADSALHSGSKSIRFQATAQRPYIQLSVAVAANSVYMAQATVEAAATSNLLSNLLAIATQPAGATTVFIKNGTIVDGATTSASAGDSIAIRMTTAATAGTSDFRYGLGAAGSPTGDVTLVAPMIADITGETDQTTIRPYVSVGVPADWAGTDLVTNGTFDTDTTGWTAVNSTLSIVSGKLRVTNVGANAGYCHQAITTVVGQKYVLSATVTQQTSATYSIYIGNGPGSGALGGLGTAASVEFTATATTTYLSTINTQAVDGRYTDFDNISVKPPAYHGSMVDGVKCYDTDRSGNPISTSGSYPLVGYVPWEARTNLCLQSEDLSTTWGNNNTTESVNAAVVSPNGTTTADKLVEAATNTTHTIHNTVAGTSGVYTTSVYLKAAGRTWAYITEGNSVTSTAYFDLTNGVVGTVGGTGSPSARIVDAGNGWYRCSMTFTAGANANIQIGTSTGDTISSFLGDITKGVYVWGAQLELGSFATPYIPTTTVAVARNADVLTYTGADVANIKTLAATFSRGVGVATAGTVAALSDNTANEYSSINLTSATAVRFDGVDGGVSKWQTTASNAYTPAATSKAAYSAATNSIKMDLDGTAQTEDTVATLPTVTQVQVGHLNGATVLNGPVGQIFAWTRNLSQSELGAVDRA